jgi:hypothetical protein
MMDYGPGRSSRPRQRGTRRAREPLTLKSRSRRTFSRCKRKLCAGQGQSHGVRIRGWAITDTLSRSGRGLGGDSRPSFSGGGKTPGGHGQETKAARAESGSPLRQDYRKMRPWSKPGTAPVVLIHEMSG